MSRISIPGGGLPPFYPDATLALDFVNKAFRVGAGGSSWPDFASLPGLTVTRASTKYAQTSAGVLVQFGSGVAAITDQGLLVEEARTNSIRNNTGAGGSAGVDPTNWAFTAAGLTRTVVGVGTENGWAYVELRYAGTTNTTSLDIKPDGNASVSGASAGQAWAWSAGIKLSAGTLSNVTDARLLINEYSAGPTYLRTSVANTSITPTSSLVRSSGSITTGASTTILEPIINVRFASGVVVDFTLRIYLPQLELGAFATSPIPTTSASVTRAIDGDYITGLTQAATWAVLGQGIVPVGVTTSGKLFSWSDGTASNRVEVVYNGTTIQVLVIAATVTVYSQTQAAPAAGSVIKVAISYDGTTYTAALNAVAYTSTTAGAVSGLTRLDIGMAQGGASGQWDGYVQKVVVYPAPRAVATITA